MRVVVSEPSKLGECPTWDEREGRFWWIDVDSKRISSCGPEGDDIRRRDVDDYPGSIALREDGGLLVAFRRGIALFDREGVQEASSPLPTEVVARERFNDGACDSRGRFWTGTMDKTLQASTGGLYRVDGDLSLHRMTEGIGVSNGITWSPDDTRLYHCDSTPPCVYVHDFDATSGEVANRRVFVQFEPGMGKADGCAMDSEGFLWVSAPRSGSILRYDPDGRLERRLVTPTMFPSSIAFGGPALETLYITSMEPRDGGPGPADGLVYAHEVDVPGLPTHRFQG